MFGELEGPSKDTSISMVVAFVERHLIEFSREYSGSAITNEKGLTQELCIFLTTSANRENYPFWFKNDYMEDTERGDSPSVDMGVISKKEEGVVIDSKCFSNRETFFSMEAKRLGKIPKARKREYLIGRIENGKYKECGGVERFKKEIHGKGLQYAAMIGYVQEYDFNYWHHSINSWIDELITGKTDTSIKWTGKDKLSTIYIRNTTAKFKSENSREQGTIFLFHLWVNLVKGGN